MFFCFFSFEIDVLGRMLQVYEVQFDCLKHVVEWQRDQLIQTIDWGCILKEENENLICY